MNNKSISMTIVILIIAMSSIAQVTGTFTDSRDGKTYKTVKIGKQTWMAENLAYKTGSGCWAYNNNPRNVTTYGYLYSWETAKNVCPTGWHLPYEAEWSTLKKHLGGNNDISGGKLKETDTTHWRHPNTGASNESGFTALPGGSHDDQGDFFGVGNYGQWWSTDEMRFFYPDEKGILIEIDGARTFYLFYDNAQFSEPITSKRDGCSVRCLKD